MGEVIRFIAKSGLNVRQGAQRQDMDKAIFEKRTESADVPPTKVSFGPFCLLPTQFLLLEGGKPVPLGIRALEILTALLERRCVGTRELGASGVASAEALPWSQSYQNSRSLLRRFRSVRGPSPSAFGWL